MNKSYGCDRYHKQGRTICQNSLLIHQERLDQVVLQAIADALDERIMARAVEKALERLRAVRTASRIDEPPSSVSYLFSKLTLAT